MPTVSIRGEPLFYQSRGESGPPCLFVHGAGGTWRHWGLQLRDLEGTRRIAVDLPGHGRSGGSGYRSVSDYVAIVLEVADALELDNFTLIGHSMGGAITQQAALTAPERVARLVLVGTGARLRVDPAILDGLARGDVETTARMIAERSHRPGAPEAQIAQAARELATTPAPVYHGDYLACNAFDIMAQLPTIRQPALVVTGQDDGMTPPKYAEYLAAQLPDGRLVLVPDAGHMVMLEQPAALTAALADFVTLPA